MACPLVAEAQELYPCLAACSFDKGFHSPANRERLDAALELNALPRKGRLSKADREREGAPAFRAARRAHAAVESAINNLEQRGLGRVRARGADGFERMVGAGGAGGEPAPHRAGAAAARNGRGSSGSARSGSGPHCDWPRSGAGARTTGNRPRRSEASQRCARSAKTPLEGPKPSCCGVRNGTESALIRRHIHPYTGLSRAPLGPNQGFCHGH